MERKEGSFFELQWIQRGYFEKCTCLLTYKTPAICNCVCCKLIISPYKEPEHQLLITHRESTLRLARVLSGFAISASKKFSPSLSFSHILPDTVTLLQVSNAKCSSMKLQAVPFLMSYQLWPQSVLLSLSLSIHSSPLFFCLLFSFVTPRPFVHLISFLCHLICILSVYF